MLDINATLAIIVISFLLFVVALDAVLIKPIANAIETRKGRIKSDLEAAKKSRSDAEEATATYQQHLAEIREQAQKLMNDSVQKANAEQHQLMAKVQEEGRLRIEEARKVLANDRKALIDGLVDQEFELVNIMTNKLIGETPAITIDRQTVQKVLEEAC